MNNFMCEDGYLFCNFEVNSAPKVEGLYRGKKTRNKPSVFNFTFLYLPPQRNSTYTSRVPGFI